MIWDHLRWGIEFRSLDGKPELIGSLWLNHTPRPYDGEPRRALLFTTRAKARAYCAENHARYAGRPDCCGQWRFRPVRVRETVRVVKLQKRVR